MGVKYQKERAYQMQHGFSGFNLLDDESKEELSRIMAADAKALDCSNCEYRQKGCKYAFTKLRLPVWAGGEGQCRRFMVDETNGYSWVNGDGIVITIPDEVVTRIRNGNS